MQTEKRFYPTKDYEVRLETRDDDDAPVLVGMAPPFDSWSPVHFEMQERFARDAFEGSGEDVISTWEHDNSKILGRLSAGTLRIEDRDDGSHYEVPLGSGRSYESDLVASIKRREILGSSFEFSVPEGGDEWERGDDGIWRRTVVRAVRYQVGPVAQPFYFDSTLALRSLKSWQEEHGVEMPIEYYERRLRLQRHRLVV